MSQGQPGWIGHTLHNRYRIEELLGTGGMAIVYKATDLKLQREVAIKLIHYHLAQQPEFVKRFKREAAAVAKLRHPNIVALYDFKKDTEPYYMVLAYVNGQSLQERLKALKKSNQVLPLSEIIRIMSILCDAVGYAHKQKIIHRDLKPSNVLFDKSGHLNLTDFAIARIAGEEHTMTVTGTAYYMSPEQARGEQTLDQRSDIYSLGVMLYELACGQTPFQGSLGSLIYQHTQVPIPDIRLLNNNIPNMLVNVIEKALAKEPADRFQSASEMATALRTLDAEGDTKSQSYTTKVLNFGKVESAAKDVPSNPPTRKKRPAPIIMLVISFLLVAVVIIEAVMVSGVFSPNPLPPTPPINNLAATSTPIMATVATVAVTPDEPPATSTKRIVATPDEPQVTPTKIVVRGDELEATPTKAPADLRFGVTDRGMNCPLMTEIVARILEEEQGVSVEIVEYETTDELFAALASKEKEIELTLCVADPEDRSYITKHVGYIKQIGDAIWESEEAKWLVMVNGTFLNPLETEMPCVYDFFQKLNFDETDFQEQEAKTWVENHADAIDSWRSCKPSSP